MNMQQLASNSIMKESYYIDIAFRSMIHFQRGRFDMYEPIQVNHLA